MEGEEPEEFWGAIGGKGEKIRFFTREFSMRLSDEYSSEPHSSKDAFFLHNIPIAEATNKKSL